jgi:hypothetical protein
MLTSCVMSWRPPACAALSVAQQEAAQARDEKVAAEVKVRACLSMLLPSWHHLPGVDNRWSDHCTREVPLSPASLYLGCGIRSHLSRGCHGAGHCLAWVWCSGESPSGAVGFSTGTGRRRLYWWFVQTCRAGRQRHLSEGEHERDPARSPRPLIWDDHMWSLNYLHACLC